MPKKSRPRSSQGNRPPKVAAGKTVPAAQAANKPWQIAGVCVVLAVATLFAFRGVRNNDFVTYDDLEYVGQNLQVQHGLNLHSIEWAFTTFHAINWHPLTWISHMVDWSLYGTNPAGHHMTSLYIHAASAVLLFLFLLYTTGYLGRAAIVASLFALHPAHVESVAWVAERKDVLCAFFWFATLFAYAWYVRKPSWKRYALIVFAYACALMSKPMAVTLPFTLLLLDYWPLRRIAFTTDARTRWLHSFWKLCIEKWPLFIMAALSSAVTFYAQRVAGAVAELQALPLWERFCNAAVSYLRYIRIMFWPNPLRAFYYYDSTNIVIFAVLSILALILVSFVCWHFRKERPYCLVGWLWFLGTLVPVIGIVQVGGQAMAERYTYVPLIGLFIIIVWLAGDAIVRYPKIRIVTQLLAIAVLAACIVKTEAQVKLWKDSETLFSHTLAIDPRGSVPNFCMSMGYERQGRFTEAQVYLDRALHYNPYMPQALSYSAFCLMRTVMQTHDQSNLLLAGQRLELALRVTPGDPYVLTNLALWSDLSGRPRDEETYSRRAIAADPNLMTARLYLAKALQDQNKLDEAAQEWREALEFEPDYYIAHYNLGIIFERQGLSEEALKEYRLSLAIQPNQAIAHSKIGGILMGKRQFPEAVDEFSLALRFAPSNPNAHDDLGVALYQLGDYEKAAEQFSDALRIDPSYADAKRNLDLAEARMKTGKGEKR